MLKRGSIAKRSTLPLLRNSAAFLHTVVAAFHQQQGQEGRSLGSNALSVPTAGSSTPPAALPMMHTVENRRTAPLPSTAPSSLPDPSSYRERSKAGEDLVLPTSPQQQQRLRTTSDSSNQNSYINDDDDGGGKSALRTSCAMSAVTTPRAAWAEEGDPILDDVAFAGSSNADDHSSDAAGSCGFRDGATLRLGEDGVVNGSPMAPTTADMMSSLCQDEVRSTDGLGLLRCLDVVRQPRRAVFGKPSTKVCRPCICVCRERTSELRKVFFCFFMEVH